MSHITQILNEHKSVNGGTLYDHLVQLLDKIENNPNKFSNDLTFFQLLSDFVKKNSYNYKIPHNDKLVNNIPLAVGDHDEWIQKCLESFDSYKKPIKQLPIFYQDFFKDSRQLQWAGYSFGEEQNYRIAQSLKRLAVSSKAKDIRFWGKILTRTRDYYVVEGVTSNDNADKLPSHCEQKGQGVNFYTYWVSYNVLDEWIQLPLVTPDQVQVARRVKYIFTGDLDAIIKSYPPFPGKQRHFLRAQIARISSATVIVPKGLYKTNDENEKPRELVLEQIEGIFKVPEYGELKNLDTWVHLHPALLGLGRTTHYVDPTLSEEQKQAITAQLTDKDPEIERLRGISDEKLPQTNPDQEAPPNWTVKQVGDSMTYNQDDQSNNYGVTIVRNMTWPGASLVASSNGWVNIYVGYGLQINQTAFTPLQPDDIQDEGEDFNEHPEPNPSKPPPPPVEEKQEGDPENPDGAENPDAGNEEN